VSTKKTTYGLKAYGIGPFVKEISFKQVAPSAGVWSAQSDQLTDLWAKQNTTEKVWTNGTNG